MGIVAKFEDYILADHDKIDWDEVAKHVPPREIISYFLSVEQGYPVGLGYYPDKGWFMSASGQGPSIVWCEWEQQPSNGNQ